ncbi:MAG: hypothetical protein NVSMB9_26470 [Isosphaeraceae bacterium]
MTAATNRSRTIRRTRRSRAEIERIKEAVCVALNADWPMTIRQLFYRLVGLGVIDKTEPEYKGTVVRLLGEMRREGSVPFDMIADNTRWMRKPHTHTSLDAFLRRSSETYRRAVWDYQDAYVEVWLEKDALAGVLIEETAPWDVPLMVTRGYASLSYLHSAAEAIEAKRKPAFLYYFGDHDPSGVDITRAVEEGLREFAPGADIVFERVAVTVSQIKSLSLPTRPTKTSDSRSKGFEGGSVEVDAIPPADLRRLVKGCITRHIDPEAHERLLAVEQAERETLIGIVEGGGRP